MVRRLAAPVLLAGLLLHASAHAQIYRWTNPEGVLHFTHDLSRVPPEQRLEAEGPGAARLNRYTSPDRPSPAPFGRSKRVLRIPFEREGNALIVQVRINDRVTAPFVVDTGATDVSVPASVASEAGIWLGPHPEQARYHTANGVVTRPVVVLESVEVGEARLENVRASLSPSMDVGLLGGSFFNNFTFQIDPAGGEITAVPNERVRAGLSERQWRTRFQAVRGRIRELDRYLEENQLAREGRVEDLMRHREELLGALETLESEANRADVPRGWRE